MRQEPSGVFDSLIHKLDRLATLTPDDHMAVKSWPVRVHHARKYDDIAATRECRLLVAGVAARFCCTPEGQREIVSFHFAGDFIDLPFAFGPEVDSRVLVLSEAVLAHVPRQCMFETSRLRPAVEQGLWNSVMVDAAISRRWLLSIGHRDAQARTAHLLCEIAWRLADAGCGELHRFDLPMSQEQLGDALGLTSVHVNRTMRSLQALSVIRYETRRIEIIDYAALGRIGSFSPDYLSAALHSAHRSADHLLDAY